MCQVLHTCTHAHTHTELTSLEVIFMTGSLDGLGILPAPHLWALVVVQNFPLTSMVLTTLNFSCLVAKSDFSPGLISRKTVKMSSGQLAQAGALPKSIALKAFKTILLPLLGHSKVRALPQPGVASLLFTKSTQAPDRLTFYTDFLI